VMTEGGPGDSTEVTTYLIYDEAFHKFDFGYASTISVLLFAVVLVATISQFVYFERRTTYEVSG
jgi:multiple sugar transport system permease protein